MNSSTPDGSRFHAFLQFLAAVVYFFLAWTLAHGWALAMARQQWVQEQWTPLITQTILVFFLLLGYAGMGLRFNRQTHPFSEQGFPLRPDWQREAGLGLATGWALVVVCVLPLTVIGGIAIVLVLDSSAWSWLVLDAVFFALATLAEEIAFRGYGFQRLVRAVGPLGATLGYAVFYAIVQSFLPGANDASFAVAIALGLLLATAYLRTRALWMSWGLNFGWKASRALVFGLAMSGISNRSPIVQGTPMGPFWLTGGGFGLDASWWALLALLAALPVVYRLTRELDYRYNTPEITPGGIAVDLEAARHRQETVPGQPAPAEPASAASGLIQIRLAAKPPETERTPPLD
ncbi:MAG: CPBP family intramembrane glutamic endopeptidase [Terracidiphilus sp.]